MGIVTKALQVRLKRSLQHIFNKQKGRTSRGIRLLALVVVLLSAVFIGRSLLPNNKSVAQRVPLKTVVPTSKVIIHENALPGTTSWLPAGAGYSTSIQAYANATSILPGHS